MRERTQRERVLEILRAAGPRGVHSFEFYEQMMPRAAAVICQLNKDGFHVRSTPEKSPTGRPGCRYVLVQVSVGSGNAGRIVGAGREQPAPTPTSPALPVNADGLDSECRGVMTAAPSSPSAPSSRTRSVNADGGAPVCPTGDVSPLAPASSSAPSSLDAQEALFTVEPVRPTHYAQEAA